MLRLLALVPKAPGIAPNQRFRHEQWAPHLARDHDVTLEFEPFESPALTEVLYQPGSTSRKVLLTLRDSWRRWVRRSHARTFDGAVVVREATMVGGSWYERALHRARIRFLFDFDDAIWIPGSGGANGLMARARFPGKTATLCRLAAGVTVGNAFLAEYARNRNRNVAVVRTSIDINRFRLAPPPGCDAPFTVVWTGSHSTIAHLERLRPALEIVGRQLPTRLRVICDVPPRAFEHVALDFVPWTPEREAADLIPGHVGVMPLPDTDAARGKCGCKALQYMAVGRPAVVSPIAINREIVRDGENGLWADTTPEWVDALLRLAASPALRARLGTAARDTVLKGFTAQASAARFAQFARAAFAPAGPSDRSRVVTRPAAVVAAAG